LFTFGGIALIITGLAIGAVLTPQEWEAPGIVLMIAVPTIMWGIAVAAVLIKWFRRPDWVDPDGEWAVWTNGVEVTKADVARAILYFADNFPTYTAEEGVTPTSVREAFYGARIEFHPKPIIYGIRKYNGLQRGKWLAVNWLGGFHKNAFFHEGLHLIDELVLKREPDRNHEYVDWWEHVPALKRGWK